MPIGTITSPVIVNVTNTDFVQKQIVPENPKVRKTSKSETENKQEDSDSEKTKEKKRSENFSKGIDISI